MEGARGDWVRGITPHGLLCGLLLAVCVYWTRNWDTSPLLFEIMLVIPCSAISGFLVARGGAVEVGMASGAATATTGHVVAVLAAALYYATTGPWLISLTWAVIGVTVILLPVVLGAALGACGAVLARFIWTTPA